MDSTLNPAKRFNRRRGRRNYDAWQRFSLDGRTCRYCEHDGSQHLVRSGQPHFFRPATESEQDDIPFLLYRHWLPDGGSVWMRRIVVAKCAELIVAYCLPCAESMGTSQVLCFQRTRAIGEVVGL